MRTDEHGEGGWTFLIQVGMLFRYSVWPRFASYAAVAVAAAPVVVVVATDSLRLQQQRRRRHRSLSKDLFTFP